MTKQEFLDGLRRSGASVTATKIATVNAGDVLLRILDIKGELYAKIEYYSPGLSKKDRIAKYMLDKAIKEGKLKKGQTVIEKTFQGAG